jgi:hypothetical protein
VRGLCRRLAGSQGGRAVTVLLWLRDHILPGLATTAAGVGLSHFRLKRHFKTVTDQQTGHLEQMTADQTRTLKGGSGKGES